MNSTIVVSPIAAVVEIYLRTIPKDVNNSQSLNIKMGSLS